MRKRDALPLSRPLVAIPLPHSSISNLDGKGIRLRSALMDYYIFIISY